MVAVTAPMLPPNDFVNDALGIAQFICQHLDEIQAVSYLLTIQELSIDDWIEAKSLLPGVNKTNRRTKENNISDVVDFFKNSTVEVRYLVANLTLCPGWHPACLNIIFSNYILLDFPTTFFCLLLILICLGMV